MPSQWNQVWGTGTVIIEAVFFTTMQTKIVTIKSLKAVYVLITVLAVIIIGKCPTVCPWKSFTKSSSSMCSQNITKFLLLSIKYCVWMIKNSFLIVFSFYDQQKLLSYVLLSYHYLYANYSSCYNCKNFKCAMKGFGKPELPNR